MICDGEEAAIRRISLTQEQRQQLTRLRDTACKPYVRERCAAILKVADGMSVAQVAGRGLLRRRRHETVSGWLSRFEQEGVQGLRVRPGRGRKPAFSPQRGEQAKQSILHLIRRDPRQCGLERSRWTLSLVAERCHWLGRISLSGMSRVLGRLGISYKRGREYIHSPDPHYVGKLEYLDNLVAQARGCSGRLAVVYQDELTYYRQPTVAPDYGERGGCQPLARRSCRSNTATRVAATLDFQDGRVVYFQGKYVGVKELVRFYQQLRDAYADAERIYVVQDNWPVHYHPDVLVALEVQEFPWPRYVPAHWPKQPSPHARRKWGGLRLPIQLVGLPTYASWTNPIEKLWRKAKQEVLHLHRLADRLDKLRETMAGFLHAFAQGSDDLLRYVGLRIPA